MIPISKKSAATLAADLEPQAAAVKGFLEEAASFRGWREGQKVIQEMAAAEDAWQLVMPVVACLAVGGDEDNAVPVAAAWTVLRLAANLIDAVQDGDPLPASIKGDRARALSCATGLIFMGFDIVHKAQMRPGAALRLGAIFAEAGLDSSKGQGMFLEDANHLENSGRALERFWTAVILKSGSIYRAGAGAGAAAGSDQEELVAALGEYGTAIGAIRQILDDCRDLILDPAIGAHEIRLPILLHAMREIDGGYETSSAGRSQAAGDLIDALQADRIPERIAAVLLEWHRRASQSLRCLEPGPSRDVLEDILDLVLSTEKEVG